jgi:ADP-heptose:LPS heptosyltransferase
MDLNNLEESVSRLNKSIRELRDQGYDKIINLSFSPVSSYLTHAISSSQSSVYGYTRFDDGTLKIADEVSAYFFAQVGIGKSNRVHLADIFASILGLDYVESDWSAPQSLSLNIPLPERYIVVHIGASERHKVLRAETWIDILNDVALKNGHLPIVLVGSADEAAVGSNIQENLNGISTVNLVGQTQISELFGILMDAELLIGCDSAPIHMASLTDTPTFNISMGEVNFWETGPKATLSFIYRVEDENSPNVGKISGAINSLLAGEIPTGVIYRSGGMVSYEKEEGLEDRFQWELIRAIYMGANYPIAEKLEIVQAAMVLQDVNDFALEQLSLVSKIGLEKIIPLLGQADELINSISQKVPEMSPLIGWYQAEKVCIGPGSTEELLAATISVHNRLASHLNVYVPRENKTKNQEICDGAI